MQDIEKRIQELFNRYYSKYYELIDIKAQNTIRNSIFIFKCKTCGMIIEKEGKYLYKNRHVPKHNCYLNLDYNFKITKKEIEERLKYLKEKFNKDFKLINFTREWFLKNFKSRAKTKIILQCNRHPEYTTQTTINNFLNDSGFFGCRLCANEKLQKENKMNLKDIQKFLNSFPKHFKFPDLKWFQENYKNSYTKFSVYCTKHHYLNKHFSILRIRNGASPCPFCSKKLLNYEDFLIRAREIHFNQYDYLISKYEWYSNYKNYKTFKIKIHCKKCNSIFEQKIVNHLDGYGCPFCSASKGERKIQYLLQKYKINFEYQKVIKNNKKIQFIFDFYLPDYNLVIEYDGEPHYQKIDFYGGERGLKERQERDRLKDQYCKENNIKLLRIPYWEYENIEKILKENLNI